MRGIFTVGKDAVAVVDAGVIHHAVKIVFHVAGIGTGGVFRLVHGVVGDAAVGIGGVAGVGAVVGAVVAALLTRIVACGIAGIIVGFAAGSEGKHQAEGQQQTDDFSSHIVSPLSFRYPNIVCRFFCRAALYVFGNT